MRRSLCCLAACILTVFSQSTSANEVTIGFAGRTEPFVFIDQVNPGISVEIVRAAFKLVGHEVKPVFQFYKRNKEEVKRGRLDGATATASDEDNIYYSMPCITYDNVAIVRKRDNIAIDGIEDLPGHTVVAWQDAHDHLGGEFQRLFGGHVRDDYVRKYFDLADQEAQVRMFWSGRADIIVVDDVIFDYMTSTMSDDFDTTIPVERHRIFGGLTHFSIAFHDRLLRDRFDTGLAKLRAQGGIEPIYKKYRSVRFQQTAEIR